MIKRITFSFLLLNSAITKQLITTVPLHHFSTQDSNGSSSKKYSSSFKIRSRLAEFFKHIHPDQMNQAPTKIKDENMRSLKNFNQYIDAVNQQKSIEGKLLKFYISQKTNHKSKKFYSFNLELPQIQNSKMNEQKAQKLLDNIVNALNTKFNEAQQGPTKKKQKKSNDKSFKISKQEEESIKIQTQEQRIQREQQTIKPFEEYRSFKDQLTMERLKNQINSKYMQTQKQNLEMKLRKNVSFADTASSRPMMWARLSMEESGLYKDYQDILNSLIDPKLIYFSQKLTEKQIQEFKKKLLPGGLDPLTLRNNDYINDVCQEMESFDPPLCFLVDNHYAGDEIPGFFTVPYNFKPKELKLKFDELKVQIEEEQQTYIQYYDYFKELQKQLRQNNNIDINLKEFKGNKDISEKILMMKRLSRFRLEKPDGKFNKLSYHPTFYPMTKQEYEMTVNHYIKQPEYIEEYLKKTAILLQRNEKRKVCHLINFKDEDLEKIMSDINVQDELNYKYGWQDEMMQQDKTNRKEILQNEGL